MASIPIVLHRLRRIRREERTSRSSGRWREYESAYRELLAAVESAGGEDALDEVGDWLVDRAEQHDRLPTPETLRTHAREVLAGRGVQIPEALQSSL